jgi:hypothetical protein
MSNSRKLTTDVIKSLLLGDVSLCFKGGNSNMQVTDNILEPQFFGNVFSSFTVGLV